MADAWAVALALAAVVGALRPSGVPLLVGLLVAAAGVTARRPLWLCLAVALLASALAQRSLAGLEGLRPAPVHRSVTLLTDPERTGDRVEAEVRLGRRHVELQARGAAARVVEASLAGERLLVHGSVAPLAVPDDWSRSRHLAGRLSVGAAERAPPAASPARAANGFRRALARGAAVLGPRRASLFGGLVIGDDRDQPPDLVDDFRGAGLVHLLAVSGQNVAFVLAVLGPVARRLRLWPRLAVTLAVVGAFALLTRFEPSVLRATAMAALAATSTTIGRPATRLRSLALAVTGLVLLDPLLVRSLGFQLSVAAVTAIAVAAAPIARALPGPRWVAEPAGVTLAAQLGVAPLLLHAVGPLPVASLPANLLAVPVAGLVMVWGMTAGPLAGLGGPIAGVVHRPTGLLLWWIEEVAARAARVPLGEVGGPGVAVAVAGLLALVGAGTTRPRARRRAAGVLVAVALVAAAGAHAPPPLRSSPIPGVVRWHRGATDVLALGGGSWQTSLGPTSVLGALRRAHVGAIDVVVAVSTDVPAGLVEAVAARHPTSTVLVPAATPPARRPAGAVVVPAAGALVPAGSLLVRIVPTPDRLVVEAWPAPG